MIALMVSVYHLEIMLFRCLEAVNVGISGELGCIGIGIEVCLCIPVLNVHIFRIPGLLYLTTIIQSQIVSISRSLPYTIILWNAITPYVVTICVGIGRVCNASGSGEKCTNIINLVPISILTKQCQFRTRWRNPSHATIIKATKGRNWIRPR